MHLDISNQVFGRLTPIKFEEGVWICKCQCGNTTKARTASLRNGHKQSCGCYGKERRNEAARIANTTHGLSDTAEFQSWVDARKRCYSPDYCEYARYGGRGILMCEEWKEDFAAFYQHMGPKPSAKHTLERIDGDGNYEPGNCRWATRTEQANNRCTNVVLEWKGESHSLTEWSRILGIPQSTLNNRHKSGWPVEEILGRSPSPLSRA